MSPTRKLFLLVVLPLLVALAGVTSYFMRQHNGPTPTATTQTGQTEKASKLAVTWDFLDTKWQASSTPIECASPLVFAMPVDIAKVTAILYPGQTRGQYKPHGGFRLEDSTNTTTVTAPYDATITQASRYIQDGEIQYMFDFLNECGIAYRLDHLLTLSPKLQSLADTLPAAQVNNSSTTSVSATKVKTGEVLATAIGFAKTKNVFIDFGVYDLRTPNAASSDAIFKAAHADQSSQAYYGTCWLDLLGTENSSKVRALPGGDGQMGKTSDYCK